MTRIYLDAATEPQLLFIESLRKQLHISTFLLDNHTSRKCGCTVSALSKGEASQLIEEMKEWAETSKGVPAAIQREAGQTDLPGFGS